MWGYTYFMSPSFYTRFFFFIQCFYRVFNKDIEFDFDFQTVYLFIDILLFNEFSGNFLCEYSQW